MSNRTYVTNYQTRPLPVIMPVRPVYYPDVLTPVDKIKYVDVVRHCGIPEVESAINVINSKTITHALYKETVMKVETKENNYFVKVIVENGKETPELVDVTPCPAEEPEEFAEETG